MGFSIFKLAHIYVFIEIKTDKAVFTFNLSEILANVVVTQQWIN